MPRTNPDCITVQIVGVGGQGALTVSKIIGHAAVEKDIPILVSEVHGMAQRGGVVQTTVRLDDTRSSLPFATDISVILGFEPLEVYRARDQITEDTVVIINRDPIRPISVSSGGQEYPDVSAIEAEARKNAAHVYSLSAHERALEAGNEKTANVVMLGALVGTGLLPFSYEEMKASVSASVPPKALEANLAAFDLGYTEVSKR